MNMNISELTPKSVWKNFESITKIPRPSGKKEAISSYLESFGKSLHLETFRDKIGNVVIRKPATKGYEDHLGVILQAHMDMVPQKNSDITFDFEKDPIDAYIEGEWVTARGTTLGADDGIGLAAALSILEDDNIAHPDLEVLFTVDEETGMYGALDLEAGVLKGKTLLNLDSEEEGYLYIGCAGGIDSTLTFDYLATTTPQEDIGIRVSIKGCKGGHSGCDINLQRANAIKLLFRFLKEAVANYEARLSSVRGGSLRNSIPREAEAVLTIPEEVYADFCELVDEYEDLFIAEFDGVEDNLQFSAEKVDLPPFVIPEEIQDSLIHSVIACPDGVYRMIPELPDIVETSNNLAIIDTQHIADNEYKIFINCLTRSSVESRKTELAEAIDSCFALAGAKVEFSGEYPGWKPNLNSRILSLMEDTYTNIFDKKPRIVTIHAGLECGIIRKNYPQLDMISFGPTIKHPHSPDEKVNIQSVEKFYTLLKSVLEKL